MWEDHTTYSSEFYKLGGNGSVCLVVPMPNALPSVAMAAIILKIKSIIESMELRHRHRTGRQTSRAPARLLPARRVPGKAAGRDRARSG